METVVSLNILGIEGGFLDGKGEETSESSHTKWRENDDDENLGTKTHFASSSSSFLMSSPILCV